MFKEISVSICTVVVKKNIAANVYLVVYMGDIILD